MKKKETTHEHAREDICTYSPSHTYNRCVSVFHHIFRFNGKKLGVESEVKTIH